MSEDINEAPQAMEDSAESSESAKRFVVVPGETIIEGELWNDVDFHVLLPALRHCIRDLRFLMSQDIYQWTRYNGFSNLFSVMSVDGTLVDILIENDEVTRMEKITFTQSPRRAVATEVNELVRRMNTLARKSQAIAKESHRDGTKPK